MVLDPMLDEREQTVAETISAVKDMGKSRRSFVRNRWCADQSIPVYERITVQHMYQI